MKTAIIVHTVDRLATLSKLLRSLLVHPLAGWRLCLMAQGYDAAAAARFRALPEARVLDNVHFTSALSGPHLARVELMDRYPSDTFLSLDDDMELLELSRYDTLVPLATTPGHGCVQAQFAFSPGIVSRMRARHPAKHLDEVPLVMTGGGMVLSGHTAEVIQRCPRVAYLFDDVAWSLASYLSGRRNFVSWDVWAVHLSGRPGGRNTWFKRTAGSTKVLPDPALVRFARKKQLTRADASLRADEHVSWPTGVTPLARQMHEVARRSHGWG